MRRSPYTASSMASRYGTSSGSCTPPTIWKCFFDHMKVEAISNSARKSVEASVGKTVDHITLIGVSASARRVLSARSCSVEVRLSPVFSSRVNDAWPSVMWCICSPSITASFLPSRDARTNLRGTVFRQRSTRSGLTQATPLSRSTFCPFCSM